MSMRPFQGRCHTCGHDHDRAAEDHRGLLASLQNESADLEVLASKMAALTRERDSLREERDELRRDNDAWLKHCDTLKHQVLCCGVAASHSDATLSSRGAYAGKWNSKQAEEVRALRADRDRLQALLTGAAPAAAGDAEALRKPGSMTMREGCDYGCPAGKLCVKCGHVHHAAGDAEALRGVVTAWDSLPSHTYKLPNNIADWLAYRMGPAIVGCRAALAADAGRSTEGGE